MIAANVRNGLDSDILHQFTEPAFGGELARGGEVFGRPGLGVPTQMLLGQTGLLVGSATHQRSVSLSAISATTLLGPPSTVMVFPDGNSTTTRVPTAQGRNRSTASLRHRNDSALSTVTAPLAPKRRRGICPAGEGPAGIFRGERVVRRLQRRPSLRRRCRRGHQIRRLEPRPRRAGRLEPGKRALDHSSAAGGVFLIEGEMPTTPASSPPAHSNSNVTVVVPSRGRGSQTLIVDVLLTFTCGVGAVYKSISMCVVKARNLTAARSVHVDATDCPMCFVTNIDTSGGVPRAGDRWCTSTIGERPCSGSPR